MIARISGPNLTSVVKQYTDAQLERLIHHGVKLDGTSTWIRPSQMSRHLKDDDLGANISSVRSVPEDRGIDRELTIRSLGRIGILTGQLKPLAQQINESAGLMPPHQPDPLSQGRYLVMTACTECHGDNPQGMQIVHAPSLMIAGACSEEDFSKRMRTGKGRGNRKLGLMGEVGRERFSALRDDEVSAIRQYLIEFVRQGGSLLP